MSLSVPDVETPQVIAAARDLLEARDADVAAAQQHAREAEIGLDAARSEDRAAYAAARDRGEDDPGPRHLEAAEAELADARRRLEGERLRQQRAGDALREALRSELAAWSDAVRAALLKSERDSLRAVERLENAEVRRSELRGTAIWLRRVAAGEMPPSVKGGGPAYTTHKVNASGDRLSVPDALSAIRSGIEAATFEAQRQRDVEHTEDERQAELLREQRSLMSQRAMG